MKKLTTRRTDPRISSGIAITSTYAIKQCGKLIKTVDGKEREQITKLQTRLESKIRIISPAIDMIELIAARGNTSLDSAVALTKSIRYEIQALGMKLASAVDSETHVSIKSASSAHSALVLSGIISDMKALLSQIEDAVPLINLAITTSGVNLSTALPSTVSPSRLLQASTFLSAGDSAYAMNSSLPTQIGPVFMLSLYMLFEGHANRATSQEGIRDTTWQEVVHKARVKLLRVPLSRVSDLPGVEGDQLRTSTQGLDKAESGDFFPKTIPSDGKAQEFAYQLLIIEDLDDDRFHDEDEKSGPFDDVLKAGIREVIPIHQVSKIFYADTGKILNIGADGEPNNPVLLLKRDVNAVPPRRMVDRDILTDEDDEPNLPANGGGEEEEVDDSVAQLPRENSMTSSVVKEKKDKRRFPPGLDPEGLAFEVFTEQLDSDNDEYDEDAEVDQAPSTPDRKARTASFDPVAPAFSQMHLRSSTPSRPNTPKSDHISTISPARLEVPLNISTTSSSIPALKSSLSLLELLVRLTALQQFQQSSHLAISDELLNFFLSESSSTGAGTDSERRKNMRASARQKVGFDPYSESPIRLRGEEYLHQREQDPHWNGEYYDDEFDYQHPVRSGSSRHSAQPESSPFRGSPSPSIRASKSWSRSMGFGDPLTPPGVIRSRTEVLRQEGRRKSCPLTRSESDSTLGTSPVAPGASK
jgi:hypothetical protein